MLDFDLEIIENISERKGDGLPENPYRSRFIHLLNLKTLFEFCIPAIEDYGAALKGNNWELFKTSFNQLLLFFACCNGKGTADYQRSMHTYFLTLEYWSAKQLPVMAMMKQDRKSVV